MVDEHKNRRLFKRARHIGKGYFKNFRVILWKDHISVIGQHLGEHLTYESVDIHKSHSVWHNEDGISKTIK